MDLVEPLRTFNPDMHTVHTTNERVHLRNGSERGTIH
jgi:hypothetical protein